MPDDLPADLPEKVPDNFEEQSFGEKEFQSMQIDKPEKKEEAPKKIVFSAE